MAKSAIMFDTRKITRYTVPYTPRQYRASRRPRVRQYQVSRRLILAAYALRHYRTARRQRVGTQTFQRRWLRYWCQCSWPSKSVR
eukprot:1937705-Rhodomonas_salina.2